MSYAKITSRNMSSEYATTKNFRFRELFEKKKIKSIKDIKLTYM